MWSFLWFAAAKLSFALAKRMFAAAKLWFAGNKLSFAATKPTADAGEVGRKQPSCAKSLSKYKMQCAAEEK